MCVYTAVTAEMHACCVSKYVCVRGRERESVYKRRSPFQYEPLRKKMHALVYECTCARVCACVCERECVYIRRLPFR